MMANMPRLARVAGLAAIAIIAVLPQLIPSARTEPATLPQLFPALTDLSESKALVISMTWLGLSPLSPIRADYMLNLHNDQFEGVAHFKVAEATSAKRSIAVPRDLIRAFLAAASKVEVIEKPYQPRITHTDDYPSVSIGVPIQDGQLIVGTNSQEQQSGSDAYADRTPWSITFAGRTFVVTASDLDKAFDPLLPALQYDDAIKELEKQTEKAPPR